MSDTHQNTPADAETFTRWIEADGTVCTRAAAGTVERRPPGVRAADPPEPPLNPKAPDAPVEQDTAPDMNGWFLRTEERAAARHLALLLREKSEALTTERAEAFALTVERILDAYDVACQEIERATEESHRLMGLIARDPTGTKDPPQAPWYDPELGADLERVLAIDTRKKRPEPRAAESETLQATREQLAELADAYKELLFRFAGTSYRTRLILDTCDPR